MKKLLESASIEVNELKKYDLAEICEVINELKQQLGTARDEAKQARSVTSLYQKENFALKEKIEAIKKVVSVIF